MKKQLLIATFSLTLLSSIFYSCTKDVGPNPLLDKNSAYSDKALYDTLKNEAAFSYYHNNTAEITSNPSYGSPHGNFKFKFNKIATAALGTDGKLPTGTKFPDGSMVVKETANLYAFLYKKEGSWLWGEIYKATGDVKSSVLSDPSYCTSCHNFGARDNTFSFDLY